MPSQSGGHYPTRRQVLRSVGLGTAVGLSGCSLFSADDEPVPDPVSLSGTKFDYQGGMEIGPHGGPNGQLFYAENEPQSAQATGDSPDARDGLAWFHTLAHGLFPYHFDRLDQGWEPAVIYVTDYSLVDWEIAERDGNKVMPSPTAAETFADATTLTYVVESDVIGGMGPDLLPFSDGEEVDTFVDRHGGRTVSFDDIDRQLVAAVQRTDT